MPPNRARPRVAFILWHTNVSPGGEEDHKLVGVYSSARGAAAASTRVAEKPGFRDSPEGFHVSRYEVNQDHWAEGFGIPWDT